MNDEWEKLYGAIPNMPHARDGDVLKDAIIEAATLLVFTHVRREIQENKAMNTKALRIEISPTKSQAFVRYFIDDEPLSDDFMGMLANLVMALDDLDKWHKRVESTESK